MGHALEQETVNDFIKQASRSNSPTIDEQKTYDDEKNIVKKVK